MIRLHITAEGPTEQAFTKNSLIPHLSNLNIFGDVRSVLTSRDKRTSKEYRGGLKNYEVVKNDILSWLKEDDNPECRFTTMFDLYGLPKNFPGYDNAQKEVDPYKKVHILELAMEQDINDTRFISYIQLHEFEALIFAEPQRLKLEYLEHDGPIKRLTDMVADQNPELINGGKETAPSKRILAEIPEYGKSTSGVFIVDSIGLPKLRHKCKHFNEWLTKLEQLASAVGQ